MNKNQKGFTLVEILLVIGIIAVLATVVVVALDPVTRFNDARNSRRLADIQSILTAVQQYIVDHKGELPPGVDTTEKQISNQGSGCGISGNCDVSNEGFCVDLSGELERYLKSIPFDPATGTVEYTHYSIQADGNNIITVKSCDSTDPSISAVSR